MKHKMQWGEESIRVEARRASVSDEPENQKVLEACNDEFGEVRFRVMVGAYGPGTDQKPKPRYWWLLGESATVHCRNVDIANWFRDELMKWIKDKDGVTLEVVE